MLGQLLSDGKKGKDDSKIDNLTTILLQHCQSVMLWAIGFLGLGHHSRGKLVSGWNCQFATDLLVHAEHSSLRISAYLLYDWPFTKQLWLGHRKSIVAGGPCALRHSFLLCPSSRFATERDRNLAHCPPELLLPLKTQLWVLWKTCVECSPVSQGICAMVFIP